MSDSSSDGMAMHMQTGPQRDPNLKELITALSVTDRPDLMVYRKYSEAARDRLGNQQQPKSKRKGDAAKSGSGEEGASPAPVSDVIKHFCVYKLQSK